jgi:hypothetical protein
MISAQGALGAKASFSSNLDAGTAYNFQEERVWAAQFTQLKVKFLPQSKEGNETAFPTFIKLYDLEDLTTAGVRSGAQFERPGQVQDVAELSGLEERGDEEPKEAESELIEATHEVDWDLYEECLEIVTLAL